MTDRPQRFALVIEAPSDDRRPGVIRLRALLKRLLRAFGLKCVEVREVQQETEATR